MQETCNAIYSALHACTPHSNLLDPGVQKGMVAPLLHPCTPGPEVGHGLVGLALVRRGLVGHGPARQRQRSSRFRTWPRSWNVTCMIGSDCARPSLERAANLGFFGCPTCALIMGSIRSRRGQTEESTDVGNLALPARDHHPDRAGARVLPPSEQSGLAPATALRRAHPSGPSVLAPCRVRPVRHSAPRWEVSESWWPVDGPAHARGPRPLRRGPGRRQTAEWLEQ